MEPPALEAELTEEANEMKKSIIAAVVLAAVVAGNARAAVEGTKALGASNWLVSLTQVTERIKAKVTTPANAKAPAGLYGRDHCSPYDATMEPAYESEVGYYCKSKKPASVSCEIVGWETVNEGEGGPVLRPILGDCDPAGGWAGTPIDRDAPQAP